MKMRAPQKFMKCLENYYEVALRSMECIKMSLLLEKKEKFSQKKNTHDQTSTCSILKKLCLLNVNGSLFFLLCLFHTKCTVVFRIFYVLFLYPSVYST